MALTDQSLHTTGIPVTYRSDHPSVVSHDLRALAPGVATVTVTAPGASGTFVAVVRRSGLVRAGRRP